MIRRSLLPDQKQLYQDKYRINADYYNMTRFLQYGKFANLSEPLVLYRIHGNNGSLKKLKQCYWDILFIRLEAIFKMGYKMTPKAFITMIAQTAIVSILPERVIRQLYFTMKGFQVAK